MLKLFEEPMRNCGSEYFEKCTNLSWSVRLGTVVQFDIQKEKKILGKLLRYL